MGVNTCVCLFVCLSAPSVCFCVSFCLLGLQQLARGREALPGDGAGVQVAPVMFVHTHTHIHTHISLYTHIASWIEGGVRYPSEDETNDRSSGMYVCVRVC